LAVPLFLLVSRVRRLLAPLMAGRTTILIAAKYRDARS
jgi:hypothetical protein